MPPVRHGPARSGGAIRVHGLEKSTVRCSGERQRKQQVPTLDDVADAVAVLASRAVGILKPNNGGYVLTMRVDTALRRLQALTQIIATGQPSPATDANPARPAPPSTGP